jgi:serine/threonine kinase 32
MKRFCSFRTRYVLVHLERLKHLSEEAVKLYTAELSSALSYLHQKRIIHRSDEQLCPIFVRFPLTPHLTKYRDIKPDNILLDEQGHAHLTDFNIAVHYSERRLLTGVAGSMAYMAPEILIKKGYSYTIDWWSLGVCVYELIFGRRPFRGRTNGDLTHSIIKDTLRFPDDAEMKCSKHGMEFLTRLLERDITKRLGCRPDEEGLEDIREHPWLSSLEWDKLEDKLIPPPFIPDVRPLSCSWFSPYFHHSNSFDVRVGLTLNHSFIVV